MAGTSKPTLERLINGANVNFETGCWVWQKTRNQFGYGDIRFRGGHRGAHRVSYTLLRGEIPDGLTIDHLCRNRACINPDHLEPVTNAENNRRGNSATAVNARKTHCIRGHEFTEDNTYRVKTGGRRCRACHLAFYRVKKGSK